MECPIKLDRTYCQHCGFSKIEDSISYCDFPYRSGMTHKEVQAITNGDLFAYVGGSDLVSNIKIETCRKFRISLEELINGRRDSKTALARQIVMYLLRQNSDLTLQGIGDKLGGKTPATISWGYQRVAKEINHNKQLFNVIQEIKAFALGEV